MDPIARQTAEELLDHPVFDDFRDWFQPELEVISHHNLCKVLFPFKDAASSGSKESSQIKS